jgi:chemotaxis protein MotA
MDIATIFGLITAYAMMAASVVMGGGQFSSFWDTASVLMVFGGTFGALFICMPLGQVMRAPKVMMKLFIYKAPNLRKIIDDIVKLAEVARREGLLALESKLDEVSDPFLKLGIRFMIDGTKPETIEDILRTDIDSLALRHKEGKFIIDQTGRFAPAFGMIGTLLGLIIMLGQMSDPSKIGAGMAVALITTLYGAVLSNASFLCFAEKLAINSRAELIAREVIVRGVMAIQSGENPRVIETKLGTFLPLKQRKKDE